MADIFLAEGLNELNVAMTPLVVAPVGEWVSPTGDNGVLGASRARDGDLNTWAGYGTYSGMMGWTDFLVFTTEPIMCSGIRFNMTGHNLVLDIDLEYGGVWHDIFDVDCLFDGGWQLLPGWTVVPLGRAQLVTAARIRFNVGHWIASSAEFYEFQFWHGVGFPGQVPGVSLGYSSLVRYSEFTVPPLPGSNPEYSCGSRWDYQCFEVDVLNIGDTAAECSLQCYVRNRGLASTAPWSDWRPASDFECTLWCSEPWRCCFNAETYRIRSAVIEPGQIKTFRGLCWIHGIGNGSCYIQAKFVAAFGEALSAQINVPAYA